MTSTRNDFSRFPLSTTLSVSGGNHLKERAFSSNAFSSSNSIFSSSSSRSTPLPEKRGSHLAQFVFHIYINLSEDMSSLSSVLGITSRPSSVGFGWSYSTPSPRIPKPVDGPIKFEPDTFSRKVFVGGLPPDIDEGESHVYVKYFTPCIAIIGTVSVKYSFMGIFVIDFFVFYYLYFVFLRSHQKEFSSVWRPDC